MATDNTPETKAEYEDLVVEPSHTRAITTFQDNVVHEGEVLGPEDDRGVRRWFGQIVDRRDRIFDDEAAAKFLEFYSRSGRKADASLYAGCTLGTVIKWENENQLFRELVQEAHAIYLNMLEAEALRRGAEGVLEPIVAGKDPEIVTYKRVFSDKLLEGLLKKADPAGWGQKDGMTVNVQTGVLVAPEQLTSENDPLPVEDIPPDDDDS